MYSELTLARASNQTNTQQIAIQGRKLKRLFGERERCIKQTFPLPKKLKLENHLRLHRSRENHFPTTI